MGNIAQAGHCRCLCAPLCVDSEKTFTDDLDWDSSTGAGASASQGGAKRSFVPTSSVFRVADAGEDFDAATFDAAVLMRASLQLATVAASATNEAEGGRPVDVALVEFSDGLCEGVVGEEDAVNGTDRNVQLTFSLSGGLSELPPPAENARSGTSTPCLRTVSFASEDGSFAGFQEFAPKLESRYMDGEEGNEAVMEEKTDSIGRVMRQQGFTRVKSAFV